MVERIADNAAPRDERGRRQTVAQRLQRLYAVRGRNECGNVGLAGLDQQCIADQAKHLVVHRGQITACVVIFVQQADCRRQITGFQVLGQANAIVLTHDAERRRDRFLVHRTGCRRTVEHGKRVSHGAVRQPGDQACRTFGQRNALTCRNIQQPAGNVLRTDAAEIEPLTARQNGRRYLVKLGGSEDEQNVLRRLLKCFEQRIERTDGQHVYLVDDEHALADLCRRVARLIAQVADVVHAVVGRRVNLGHVQHRAVQNAAARRTLVARIAVHRMLAVDRAREDLRTGGLTGAARACKQICMAQTSGLQLRAQRVRDMLLPDHIRKRLRPPFAV